MQPWFLYILQSDSTGRLYTGITTEPERRLREHNGSTRGAKYTRAGRPWKIVHLEPMAGRVEAMKRELAVKRLSRKAKLALVQSSIPNSDV